MLLEDYSARLKKTLGDRAFKTAAPKIWNILPEDIRMQDNYNIFKRQLKTHYFRLENLPSSSLSELQDGRSGVYGFFFLVTNTDTQLLILNTRDVTKLLDHLF